MNQKPKVIQSVQRAIDILECFNYEKKELSLGEISETLGLNPSTVHGILLTLQVNSYIEKISEKSKYKLGAKLIEKGAMVLGGLDIRDVVSPYLELLTEKFQETSYLCIYQQGGLYVIDKLESTLSTFSVTSKVGLKIPLHSTASGKLVLAYLDEKELDEVLKKIKLKKYTENTLIDVDTLKQDLKKIKAQGYSLENEEIERGLNTISAPVLNHMGDIIGTIGVLGPTMRMKDKQDMIIKDLVPYSKKVSKNVGYGY